MKLFLKKTLVVMMAVIITSLFVKGIIQVGDTTITQESSRNYNGYLPLILEDKILSIGGQYGDYGYGYDNLELDLSRVSIGFHYMPFAEPINIEFFIHGVISVSYLYINRGQNNISLFVQDVNGQTITYNDYDEVLIFYGYSNYEVIQ